jgi:hypothetical protein
MTERVDLDRLADFVGGALDGTPDAAEVHRLVATDPEWAAAHEDLAAAMSSVGAELRSLGAVVDPVPEDVVARIDHHVRNLSSSNGTHTASRTAEAAPDGPGGLSGGAADAAATSGTTGGTATVARDDTPPGGRGPSTASRGAGGTGPGRARKRRTARWTAGLSAAAAVIAVGIGVIVTFPTTHNDSGAGDAGTPMMAPAAAAPTVSSGRDYRGGSFDGLDDPARSAPLTPAGERAAGAGQDAKSNAEGDAVPPELARFQSSPAALQACVDAVVNVFGGMVRVVDLARYEGQPAVVVLVNGAAAGGGRPLVVVAGENCGGTPGDPDEVFHGPLA